MFVWDSVHISDQTKNLPVLRGPDALLPPATTRRSLMSPSWSQPRLMKQWPVLASGRSRYVFRVQGVLLGSLDHPVLLISVWQKIIV